MSTKNNKSIELERFEFSGDDALNRARKAHGTFLLQGVECTSITFISSELCSFEVIKNTTVWASK